MLDFKRKLSKEITTRNQIELKMQDLEDEITMLNVERLEYRDILAQHQEIVEILKDELEKKNAEIAALVCVY